ncbi:MAG: YMGG-like glycine zipper-containing protein, partial [Gammaproteobacteria bacterium]
VVRPEPTPGESVIAGAAVGAAVGAVIGAPNSPGEGALIGAMAGSVMGAAAASSQQANAQRISESRAAEYQARLDAQAATYRRAMSACLEGRGYAVR